MNVKLIQTLYQEYIAKINDIRKIHGERDGFVINGKLWWDYYRILIDLILLKIRNNEVTIQNCSNFYREFGFGPKLYGNTFIENGIEKVKKLFMYLIDDSIPANVKVREIVEEPENENYFKGVGIAFVTLFLTTYYPDKYIQWTGQTDQALKILKLYPKKVWGEKKSEFYLKVNKICLKIGQIIKVDNLPKIDNFLYCISKGYIGKEIVIEPEPRIPEEFKSVKLDVKINIHTEMMYYLIKIGLNKNYDVWVAFNDRGKDYNKERFEELCLKEIPNFTDPATLVIAKYIDVIWFKNMTSYPVRFFEIEHTTSIYSGLLRLNDVKIDYPISKATIVISKNRVDLFEKQIDRRTFRYSELSDVCDYLIYEDLKKWYTAVNVDSQFK